MYGIYENGQVIAEFAAPLSVMSNVPEFGSDTLSLKRKVSVRPAQRWEVSTRLVPLSTTANDLFALFVEKGHSEQLQLITPQNYGVIINRNTNGGTTTASGSIDASTITVSNNGGNFIPRGCFVRFTNHNKVYMLRGSRNGDGAVGIFPRLRMAVSGNMLWKDDVIMQVYSEMSNLAGMAYVDGILQDNGVLQFLEA
jgi:hypothetical protein